MRKLAIITLSFSGPQLVKFRADLSKDLVARYGAVKLGTGVFAIADLDIDQCTTIVAMIKAMEATYNPDTFLQEYSIISPPDIHVRLRRPVLRKKPSRTRSS